MQVLDKIHNYCQENQLTYFISSGTLLGAVRHGGYIPWDDDIDIYMPRSSFNAFCEEFNNSNGRYRLINGYNTEDYYYTFPKVVDTKTLLIEREHTDRQIGIYVDIFPVDYVPHDLSERERLFKEKDKIKHLLIAKQSAIFRTLSLTGIIYRLYSRLAPSRLKLLKRFDDLIRNTSKTGQVCNLTDAGPSIKGCFNADAIAEAVDIKFENRVYKTMVGYKTYLEHTYGDYMTLPPEDKRIHHEFEAYITKD